MVPLVVGRYLLCEEFAAGGMATVHLGRMFGPSGFSRIVAIKRLHAHVAKNDELRAMFIDEARVASRVRHPNVVGITDVVQAGDDLLIVMDLVHGLSLAHLLRGLEATHELVPLPIASGILLGVLDGLHAAHDAVDELGNPLHVVHRDVSPQNILVASDGIARLVDFGIAKAAGRLQSTDTGQIKGKSAYMSPEQIRGRSLDRRSDVFACGVVLWECLLGQRLFAADEPIASMTAVLEKKIPRVPSFRSEVPEALDAVVSKALARNPSARFDSAREMALALERACAPASPREIAAWVAEHGGGIVEARARRIREIESEPNVEFPPEAPHITVHATSLEPRASGAEPGTAATRAEPRTDRRRTERRVLGAGALMLLLGGAAVAVVLARRPASTTGELSPSASVSVPLTAEPPATSLASARPPPTTEPTAAAVEAPSPLASTVASSAPPRGALHVRPGASTSGAKPTSTAKRPSRPIDCSVPFTVDAEGNRRWKEGC